MTTKFDKAMDSCLTNEVFKCFEGLMEKANALPKKVWESAHSQRKIEDGRVWAMDTDGRYHAIAWINDLNQGEQ